MAATMDDSLSQMMERLRQVQIEISQLEANQERIVQRHLMLQESLDAMAVEVSNCAETEGINSESDSSYSLCDVVNSSESLVTETTMNVEVENSAHQVFDEISDRVLDEIETQYSDIFICRSILSESLVGFVDKKEVISEFETSEYKVFDESPERVSEEIHDEFKAQFSDTTAFGSINDVIVVMDDSSNLVFRHFEVEFGILSLKVLVKDSCGKVLEFQSFDDLVYFGDFWGQKFVKEEILDTRIVGGSLESFGWKPGWLQRLNEVVATLEIVKELEMVKSIEEVSDDVIVTRIKLLSKNDVAKRLFVFSNIESDQASNDSWETNYEAVQKKFKNGGYEEVLGIVLILDIQLAIGSFGWKPGWNNVDDQLDVETNVVDNEVKDINEIVCLGNGSVVNKNVVAESSDVGMKGKGCVVTNRSTGAGDYDKNITEWQEDSAVYIREDVVFDVHSDAKCVQKPVKSSKFPVTIIESAPISNVVNKRDEPTVNPTPSRDTECKRDELVNTSEIKSKVSHQFLWGTIISVQQFCFSGKSVHFISNKWDTMATKLKILSNWEEWQIYALFLPQIVKSLIYHLDKVVFLYTPLECVQSMISLVHTMAPDGFLSATHYSTAVDMRLLGIFFEEIWSGVSHLKDGYTQMEVEATNSWLYISCLAKDDRFKKKAYKQCDLQTARIHSCCRLLQWCVQEKIMRADIRKFINSYHQMGDNIPSDSLGQINKQHQQHVEEKQQDVEANVIVSTMDFIDGAVKWAGSDVRLVETNVQILLENRMMGRGHAVEMEDRWVSVNSHGRTVMSPLIVDDDISIVEVTNELVWTSFGRKVQFVEIVTTARKGNLQLTRQPENIISVYIAIARVRYTPTEFDLVTAPGNSLLEGPDVIHSAEVVLRDGPSIGVTLLTSIVAFFSQVRAATTMTDALNAGTVRVDCLDSLFEDKQSLREEYCYMLNISYVVVVVIVQGGLW